MTTGFFMPAGLYPTKVLVGSPGSNVVNFFNNKLVIFAFPKENHGETKKKAPSAV